MLLDAHPLGAPDQYNCSYHYCFVIDHEGIVQYRGSVNLPVLEVVLAEAVSRLPVGVGVDDQVPGAAARLQPAYPNPFNPQTTIAFDLPRTEQVRLEVVDLQGRHVQTLVDGHRSQGHHTVLWNGTDRTGQRVASGTYVYRLITDSRVHSRSMVLIK